jgi:hypothetical protein
MIPALRLLAAVLAISLTAGKAVAEERQTGGPTVLSEADPQVLLRALERAGMEAEIGAASDGDPKINSTDKAHPFVVNFYDCDKQHAHCPYVQISQGWNLEKGTTAEKMEAWNADNVWGQAYLDDENDPWLALTVNFKGGVTPEYVDDMIHWWSVIEGDFQNHIGWGRN